MKLTVLGYWGAYPEAEEATSGYLLQRDNFNLLIDCGSGVLSKLQNYIDISKLDAVVLSHYHHDHKADIGVLQYGRLIQTLLGNCKDELKIYGHGFDKEEFNNLTKKPYTKGIMFDPNKVLHIGPFFLSFHQTKHPVTCFATRITDGVKTIVYTADSSFHEELISFSHGADLLISECSFYKDQDGNNAGHMNSQEVGMVAKSAGVSKLMLTHLPHFGNHQHLIEEAKEIYRGDVTIARTGLVLELNSNTN